MNKDKILHFEKINDTDKSQASQSRKKRVKIQIT